MSDKLHKFQKELLGEIKDILLLGWNPIGGEDVPIDEYDSNALRIFGLIQRQFCINILELKMFYNDPAFSKIEKIKQDSCTIADLLYKAEKDMGFDGDIERCQKVSQIIEKTAEKYSFQMKLALMQSHLVNVIKEQDKQIQTKNKNSKFSYLGGCPDPSLLAILSFVEDLLKIDWQAYNIDQDESFVEELVDPIGDGGLLRVCIKHADRTIKTFTKNEERVFMEIVLGHEGTITYPGGHTHCNYYDYGDGKYIENNEAIELIKDVLEKGLTIKYVFRGDDLIGSGIRDNKAQGFWMCYRINFKILNPMLLAKKLLGKVEKKEEIVTISWKKLP